ncbi:mechanosensitive ion channel [Thermomonas brevis]
MKAYSPDWLRPWLHDLVPVLHVAIIIAVAILLRWLVRRLVDRVANRYDVPPMVPMAAKRVLAFLIGLAAFLAILQRFGVSGGVLWGAFTGFATVAAVAFFAAWSVLTNIFCAFLIMATRPFRLHDWVELLEDGERAGLRGRVRDLNLIYVTLEETHADGASSLLRVPNSMFFQRAVRRWEGEPPPRLPAGEGGGGRRRNRMIGGAAGAADDRD